MKKFVLSACLAVVAGFGIFGASPAMAGPFRPGVLRPNVVRPAAVPSASIIVIVPAPGPIVVRPQVVQLTVTDYVLTPVWTNVGWVYVSTPVQYTVTARWSPVYQGYVYTDRLGIVRIYYPPVVVPVPVPLPLPR